MVADPLMSIAPLSAPDKPLSAVVIEPLKRSRLRHLNRRQWAAAGLAVLIAVSGLVIWRRSSAPGRDISAYTTTVETGDTVSADEIFVDEEWTCIVTPNDEADAYLYAR